MAQFIFAYHGGKMPETPEEGEKVRAAWGAWFEKMGEALVQPGAPVGLSRTVSATGVTDDGGANPLSGYSIVNAADIDAATALAKDCPMVLDGSGSAEVAEIMEM